MLSPQLLEKLQVIGKSLKKRSALNLFIFSVVKRNLFFISSRRTTCVVSGLVRTLLVCRDYKQCIIYVKLVYNVLVVDI